MNENKKKSFYLLSKKKMSVVGTVWCVYRNDTQEGEKDVWAWNTQKVWVCVVKKDKFGENV